MLAAIDSCEDVWSVWGTSCIPGMRVPTRCRLGPTPDQLERRAARTTGVCLWCCPLAVGAGLLHIATARP